jgi:AcrR family transcriptional regulator
MGATMTGSLRPASNVAALSALAGMIYQPCELGFLWAERDGLSIRRRMVKMGKPARLDGAAWVQAALDIVADQGVEGVRVEVLAKQLGVTKGSFYWHFRDRDALLEAVLASWRREATLRIISRLDQAAQSAAGRLHYLLQLPFNGARAERGAEIELSLRLWSRRDERARATLAEVDELRLRYIAGLLEDCGFGAEAAKARAVLAYAFIRVGRTLIEAGDEKTVEGCFGVLVDK